MLRQPGPLRPHPEGVISGAAKEEKDRRRRTHPERVKPRRPKSGMVAANTDSRIEAHMGKSTYEIRVAGSVPVDLLENFRQIQTVEPAGTILHAVQLDDAALWGLIDALRGAGVDLIEIRREISSGE